MQLTQLDDVIEHYKVCAIWATTDRDPAASPDDETPDHVEMEDIHKEWSEDALKEIAEDCTKFCTENIALLEDWEPSQVGHSFFLSRNGHGAGFFDFPDKKGDELQKVARAYKGSQPYLGDDGKTYLL